MTVRRARIYDILALCSALLVVGIDQWVKSLVVEHLSPPEFGPQVSLVGQYLVLYYIRNSGAAFSMFNTNSPLLIVFIVVAIAVIVYLYLRMLNSGPLFYKFTFGLIVGGAAGNLLDRFTHGGSVVDFISFRIPQINFYFAIFNLADAAISIGMILLFVSLLYEGLHKPSSQVKQRAQEGEEIALDHLPESQASVNNSQEQNV